MSNFRQFDDASRALCPAYALPMANRRAWMLVFLLGVPIGCAPPVSRGDFDAPDPASRTYAIERAAASNDRDKIPRLIEQLMSDDPLVRMLAITTLERMTGETFGYRHYDQRFQRERAIRRWVEAVDRGEVPFAHEFISDANGGSP